MLIQRLIAAVPLRAPEDDQGTPPAPTPAPTPAADPAPVEPAPAPTPPAVDDEKADLIKDVMRHKNAAREAKAAADAAAARLAAYDGIDPEEVRAFREQKAQADREAAEARGEYDRIVQSMREQHEAERQRLQEAADARAAELTAAQERINDLTIGRAFGDSKFIAESTVLSPAKARRLYEDHVEIVEGEFVVYDKPKGAKNRTPLVDARGENLNFEAGIEKVIRADADFDTIGRSKIKSGSGSTPAPTTKEEPKAPTTKAGKSRIAAALNSQKAK